MDNKKAYSRYNERIITKLTLKKLSYQIIVDDNGEGNTRLKTSLMGTIKNDFIDDCLLRAQTESEVLRSIIKVYYEIINSHPQLRGKEFKEIANYLCNNSNINK